MRNVECNFSCETCPVRTVLDKIWKPKTKCLYYSEWYGGTDGEYKVQHICGYREWWEYCDIPGHRESDKYSCKKYCILDFIQDFANNQCHKDDKFTCEWSLPTYTGTYGDLLNVD